MEEDSPKQILCFICNKEIAPTSSDIFSVLANFSKNFISKILEKILKKVLHPDSECILSTSSKCCSNCLGKINKYDNLVNQAKQIEKDIFQTRKSTEQKHLDSEQKCEIKIELKSDEITLPDGKIYYVTEISKPHEYALEDYDIVPKVSPTSEIKEESDDEDYNFPEETYSNSDGDNDQDESDKITIEAVKMKSPKRGQPVKPIRSHGINTCKECQMDFNTLSGLRQHRKLVHSTERSIACHICQESFSSETKVNAHIKAVHNIEPFSCDICGRKFGQKGALKRHYPIHTGEKPFICDKCGKQFVHYSSFQMHNLAHDDVRMKACQICGLKLRSTSHLNRHMLVHSGLKPHECPRCGQRFAQRYNMSVHLKTHDGIQVRRNKSFVCEICNAPFTKNSLLCDHKESVHSVIQLKPTRIKQYDPAISTMPAESNGEYQSGFSF